MRGLGMCDKNREEASLLNVNNWRIPKETRPFDTLVVGRKGGGPSQV